MERSKKALGSGMALAAIAAAAAYFLTGELKGAWTHISRQLK